MRILEAGGFDVDYADIMPDGKVSPDSIEKLIRDDTVLVSVTAVDSELGTVQPIREISEVVKSHPDAYSTLTQRKLWEKYRFRSTEWTSHAAHRTSSTESAESA